MVDNLTLNNVQNSDSTDLSHYLESLKSLNPRLRSFAAQEIGKIKASEAVPDLIQLLNDDLNTYVRSACAEALGHIGHPEAVFPLMDALQDSCSFVRRAAVIALGQMQAKEAQGALLRALDDPNFYVRRAAINAVGKLDLPDLGPVLIQYLEVPDPRIRRTVIIALRRLETRQAIPHMIALLEEYLADPSQKDLPVVKTLVDALGEMAAIEAVPVMINVMRGYVGVRSLTATALGQIGDERAVPALVEALEDKSSNLQLAALKSLGRVGNPIALDAVMVYIDSQDPRLRRTAALTLGGLRAQGTTQKLLDMARNDVSPLVRPAAVEALGELGDVHVVPQLIKMTDDSNAYLRAALAYALGKLAGDDADVQAVLRKLTLDSVEHVSLAAERALEQCDVKGVVPNEQACPEPDKKHRSWLRRFLGKD